MKPISSGFVPLNVPGSKPISPSGASCWLIRTIAWSQTPLEREWNDKLRALAQAQEERERERQKDSIAVDDATCARLVAMTTDFKTLWRDPTLPNRERKATARLHHRGCHSRQASS